MDNFQTILTAIFLAFFVFGVLIFSGVIPFGTNKNVDQISGRVVLWGTFPGSILSNSFENVRGLNKNLNFAYQSKDASTYQQDLIEAFAANRGPDLFIVTTDMIKKNNDYVYKIPYASYPEKVFRDAFIDGADIYLDGDGVYALPAIVDPMMIYYNKDILKNEGLVYPPKTWEELFVLNPTLTKRSNEGVISQGMIALGQYGNLNNAKDILATLLLQNGNNIVLRSSNQLQPYESTLSSNPGNLAVSSMQAIVDFFVEFSNPSDTSYTWNRSFSSSFDIFTGSKLAFYLGRASELFKIEDANPNLSFDVAQIPQVKSATNKRTFGEIYAIAINKRSTNLASAIGVAESIVLGDDAKNLSTSLSLPPASRILLSTKPQDPYLYTFFSSAIISKAWLDPDKIKSNKIFGELIENKLSNSMSTGDAINKAQSQLDLLLK